MESLQVQVRSYVELLLLTTAAIITLHSTWTLLIGNPSRNVHRKWLYPRLSIRKRSRIL
jgi:hypothetical protein